jgi:hypothetical protein
LTSSVNATILGVAETEQTQEEVRKVNKTELKVQMLRMNKTAEQLCAALGISKTSWFRKTNGESQFTQGEISALRFELELDDHQTARIFFDPDVS